MTAGPATSATAATMGDLAGRSVVLAYGSVAAEYEAISSWKQRITGTAELQVNCRLRFGCERDLKADWFSVPISGLNRPGLI